MYKFMHGDLTANYGILRINSHENTVTTVPNDPNNKDWQEYQKWLAAGNTPTPADS